MDTPVEIQLSQIDFNEPLLIPSTKPKVRVGVKLPEFPGGEPTYTILGPAESEFIKINPNFPFYKLMKYLIALNSLESLDLISRKNIQDAYEDIIASLPKKIIWKGENLDKFSAARKFILSQLELACVSQNIKLTTNTTAVIELMLYVFQKIDAISMQVKNSIKIDIQTIISDLMCSLPLMYEKIEKNSQLAESWARKALRHLESLPVVDANDITKRRFFVQMQLAIIYVEMGYMENAIYWLKTIKDAYQKFYYAESKDMYGLMIRGYQAVMRSLVSKDCFETMLIGKDFCGFLETIKNGLKNDVLNSKMTHEEYLGIIEIHQKNIDEIHGLIKQAKKNQADQFLQVKQASKDFDLVKDMKFVLSKDNMLLKFSENINEDHIQKSFERNNVKYQMLGNMPSAKLFIVSMCVCSIKDLRKICRYISHLENFEAIRKHEASKRKSIVASEVANIEPAQLSKPVFAPEVPLPKLGENKRKKVLTTEEPRKAEPVIQYHWLTAGMTYCPTNKTNNVKPLSNSSCDIWYGYIAPWAIEDKQFNPEFFHRLANARLSHDCIRDITKELLTWNNQNFSKEHPYKFKIVIPKHDERLYGWIEDSCKDSKGKMHYLICFGFIGHHKTKYLPDPENIKKKFAATHNADKSVEMKYRC